MPVRLTIVVTMAMMLVSQSAAQSQDPASPWTPATFSRTRDYRRCVQQCLDTLLEHGTDRYGEITSPMLMAVLDVNRLESPEHPETYDALVRTEGRLHRRGERGSNLWYDQNALRSMYRMTELR